MGIVFRSAIITMAMIGFSTAMSITGAGQVRVTVDRSSKLDRIPTLFQRQLATLGDRVRTVGKEQTVYVGEVTDRTGNRSPGRVIYQVPGLVRLDGFKPGAATLSFDGVQAIGVISRDDELLLETFVMDFTESMLVSVQRGAAVRFLGLGFGPDPRRTPKYNGPRYDIFEVTTPVRSRMDALVRSKLYYFDSQSGLLQSTRSYDRSSNVPAKLETRFSQWRLMDGSVYPTRIDHFEAGQLVFSFVASSIVAGPAVDAVNFR